MSQVRIYRGDCLSVLPRLNVDSISAMVTDPPYGIDLSDHDPVFSRRKLSAKIEGDSDQRVGIAALDWASLEEIPTAAFASPYKPWPGKWRNLLVWDKGPGVGRGGDPSTCFKRTWELIQVARNGKLRKGRHQSVLSYHVGPCHFRMHPAAKPVNLMAYLIEQLTDPGDTVLDPFMGSGPTGVACMLTGRNFIGIEIERCFYRYAKSRIEAAQASALS